MKLSPIVDHGYLLGLGDDDHPQYLHLNKAAQTLLQNLAVTGGVTIDGVDISAHAANASAHHSVTHSIDNLLINPDFQLWSLGPNDWPDGWSNFWNAPTRARDGTVYKFKPYSFKISNIGAGGFGATYIVNTPFPDSAPGYAYSGCPVTYSVYLKSDVNVGINVGIRYGDAVSYWREITQNYSLTGGADWQRCSVTLASMPNYDLTHFRGHILIPNNAGNQWIDGAQLELSAQPNQFQTKRRTVIPGISFNLGLATVGTKLAQALLPGTYVVQKVRLYADTAPTGVNLIVDINKNGSTIFTTQANRPTIVAGQHSGVSGTPNITSFAKGDRLSIDIDQVGSTTPGGNDLLVTII